jgi:hypothetical protein
MQRYHRFNDCKKKFQNRKKKFNLIKPLKIIWYEKEKKSSNSTNNEPQRV